MLKKICLAALIAMVFSYFPGRAAVQTPVSEEAKTRLDKKEIVDLIVKTGRMPRAQQDSGLDRILNGKLDSKTPRSDFTFCTGLAFLGNYKAQACVGSAFERGRGIVEDLTDAYIWYAIALENPIDDAAVKQRLLADKDRITLRLRSTYPTPSDEELDEWVSAQKKQMAQYRDEAKKAKK